MKSTRKVLLFAVLMASVLWFLPTPGQAAVATQLDITGGSISLNFGSLGTISGNFNANGQLLMNQFQPPPNIFDPITISHFTFSIFTSSGWALNLPAPTAQTFGSTMTANLQSLLAGMTSSNWSWVNSNPQMESLKQVTPRRGVAIEHGAHPWVATMATWGWVSGFLH